MPIGPTTYFGKERVFVDRETCIQAFRENIRNSGNLEYNVLFYHGIAGIGKSKLQKELQKILDEEYPEILWAAIDLNIKTYREVGTFLITLRNKIQEKYKTKFYLFNISHAIYWKKLHPEILLLEQNYSLIKEGGFFSKIVNVLNEFGPAHIKLIIDIINNAPDNVKRFFKEQAIDINVLTAMEATEIEKLLPGFFAADFTSYLCTNSKAYIFIDTYEALWDGLREGGFHEKDQWIRDNLIPNMLGVSWVICGREKLLWVPECDSDWDMYLEQHPVDELPESYCQEFLEDCGVENKDIRNVIIKASEGVPYYLNLSVDTYEKIGKNRQPVSEDFGKTQKEIFNTFVKYLNNNEIRALKVLSVPNSWDRTLFEILMKKFDSGYPAGAFSELIKFSFIKKDTDGKCSVHQLMRKSLKEFHDPTDRKNIHKYLLDFYSKKLENIDIKAITPEHEIALTEAFYHAKEALEIEELFNWFVATSDPFDRAAFWQLITPLYDEILQILEAKLGSDHLVVATALNNLAGLYFEIGNYDKALPLYQRAFDIREKTLGPKCPIFGSTLNRFGLLYHYMGEYEKALPLYQRALDIFENVLGPQHSIVATTLNNIAGVYLDIRDYKKALPLYYRVLKIQEKELGTQQSPYIAITLNNIGLLFHNMKNYDGALVFYQTALEIHENNLTPKYPEVIMTLNNLALVNESMGDYEKSLSFYQRALDIHESMLSPPDQYFARTLDNLAGLYESMKEYDKALPVYQRAFEITEEVLGQSHSTTIKIKNNYNSLLSKINEENEEK
jgi:tetratricopeptide (TPR) repeat protein